MNSPYLFVPIYCAVAGLTYTHMVPVFIRSAGILINNNYITQAPNVDVR
jgi:hypothetical protein